mgnify:CR=1 FL=1
MQKQHQHGFTLPVILLISVGLMIVGLSLLQSTSSIRTSLDYQYHKRLANEAAEAGGVYANYCLSVNSLDQTWGSSQSNPNLAPNTDCSGDPLAFAPSYLVQNGTQRSSFSVGNLESTRSDGAIVIPATGSYEQTRGNTAAIADSLTNTRKRVVRWKEYKASVSASGTYKTCAIVTNELYCWGKNGFYNTEYFDGQLGDGTTTDSLIPVKVTQSAGLLLGKVVDDVISEQYHNCALAQGKVYCWGRNLYGQLGNGTTTDSPVPVEVGGALSGKTVTAIGGASDVGCAIAESKVYCWGRNDQGQLGDGTTTSRNTPTLISTTNFGSPYTPNLLSSSGSRAKSMCAIINSKAYCWGANNVGQLGDGTTTTRTSPVAVRANSGDVLYNKTIIAISQDGYYNGNGSGIYPHVCVVASDNKAYCWGANTSGQLGDNSTTNRSLPVAVRANSGDALYNKSVQDIVVGLQHSCALANSQVYCWGENSQGMVGDNTSTDRRVPTAVYTGEDLAGKTVTAIGGGSNRGCAVADLTVFCWGKNSEGQLGDGTQDNRYKPTKSIFLSPKAPAYIF